MGYPRQERWFLVKYGINMFYPRTEAEDCIGDPKSQVSRISKSRRAFRLQEDLGKEPKVFYLKEGEWDDG